MVVPIPNPHQMTEEKFTLFEIDGHRAKKLREAVDELKDLYGTRQSTPLFAPSAFTSSSFGGSANPLAVQTIGSYKISVAPSLVDLEQRAPWERYSIESSQVTHILNDVRRRYDCQPYAFVIAEGRSPPLSNANSISAGFGVMYRDARLQGGFFPTSHEPALLQTDVPATTMDVTLIALGAVIKPLSILGSQKQWPMRLATGKSVSEVTAEENLVVRGSDDMTCFYPKRWQNASEIFQTLPRFEAGRLHYKTFVQLEWPSVATVWSLQGRYPNKDVLARKASDVDAAVVNALYADVDGWARSRRLASFGISCELKLDFALALLARQLAEPGLVDRTSDAPKLMQGERVECRTVTYLNLDLDNCDLDELSYREKDGRYRYLMPTGRQSEVDTLGHVYLRISSYKGSFESLEMRTVGGSDST